MADQKRDPKLLEKTVGTRGSLTETYDAIGDHEAAQRVWEAGWEVIKEAAKLGFIRIGEDE